MKFDDGREVVAKLLCATRDMDGSKHLIYDRIEQAQHVEAAAERPRCVHADAKTLVNIEHADAKNFVTGPRGISRFTVLSQLEKDPLHLRRIA
ncbi:MAG: hypothetical protein M3O31_02740 [Acidobacteriota bacterium]|nr:hypothetical protein [Acidobacteriota bacterium]